MIWGIRQIIATKEIHSMEKTLNWGGQKREQSIELLRIVLMTLIVFGHILGHGLGDTTIEMGGRTVSLFPLYFYHVDAFVFISGYFGIHLKWKKFLLLIFKMIVYSFFAIGLAVLLKPDMRMSISEIVHNVYPISACDWWFMSEYLFLMLLSPFINAGMEKLDKRQATILVGILYLSWFRCTSVLLLFIYILGRYLRKYSCVELEQHAGKIFVCTIATFFFLDMIFRANGIYPEKLYNYMSPFAVVPAVAIFYIFKRIHLEWQGIGVIASGTLAAYLITDHEFVRHVFCTTMSDVVSNNILLFLPVALCVVITCSCVDNIVTRLLKPIFNIGSKKE